MALLQVAALHSGYGANEIIHGVNFHVEEGEIVTILGPNGCGKSTFIKTILGYLKATKGGVTYRGNNITGHSPTQRISLGMGYIPQLFNIFRPLSVRANLEMGGFSLSKQAMRTRIEEIFNLFPRLGERATQNAGSLSGGERQLLAMGRALMPSPRLLFLDEPSVGLSPKMADEAMGHIKYVGSKGTSIVIVEQNVRRALSISDRGYVFVTGQVEFEGPAQAILADQRIREAYLGG
jgi:ABC-type branched-subunit amino acid transport system ATPase component